MLLVRHGSHAELGRRLSGRSEIPLDAQGRGEAEALAEGLDRIPLASLHVSPRRRALDTIAPLAKRRRVEAQVAPALDEIDFGAFAGCDFTSLENQAEWRRWNAERATARCPGGETMAEAASRATDYLLALPAAAFPALCVTHCDIIRGIVAEQIGLGFDRMFSFDCAPASVTTLALEGERMRLVTLNATVGP